MFSHILVPIDFSAQSLSGALAAQVFASRWKSRITLLHVVPNSSPSAAQLDACQHMLSSFATDELAGLPVQRTLLRGDPASEISSYAAMEGVDLIAMPTHGYGTFRQLLLGSVTAKVLHDAGCPVYTGVHMERMETQERRSFRRVLCALGLGPHSAATLAWAKRFTDSLQAELLLLHVIPIGGPSVRPNIHNLWRLEMAEYATKEITRLQDEAGTHAPVQLMEGIASEWVRYVADTVQADLLLIGRGDCHTRLPSHAYAIIRQSPCPVISV